MYEKITGRHLDLSELNTTEREFVKTVYSQYESQPEWTEFGSWWLAEFRRTGLPNDSVVYMICADLETRLGIAQGKVATPDFRDYLVDLIEERFGSRYRFCKETGIDAGHLSRVLAGSADFSLQSLERIAAALDAVLTLQPRATAQNRLRPETAKQLLAEWLEHNAE
ncbi:hypothetical protein HYV30_03195 [Candidatus Kaiserbacteria bacterium]|nr:hypothetical protein [Candidatus Kaiserbacteria bacterium]